MLSIDRQAEKIRRRDELIRQLQLLVIALGLIIIVLAIMIWSMTAAGAREKPTVCLTYKQARELWPRQHIWWFSEHHCWSNRRGGPPRNLKFDPVFSKAHAEAPILPAPTYDVLPRARPKGDRLDKADPPDDCCWPALDDLLAADREMPLRALLEKLKAK